MSYWTKQIYAIGIQNPEIHYFIIQAQKNRIRHMKIVDPP